MLLSLVVCGGLATAMNPFFVDNGPAGASAAAVAISPVDGRVVAAGAGSATEWTSGFGFVTSALNGAPFGPSHVWNRDVSGGAEDVVVDGAGTSYLVGWSMDEWGAFSACVIEAVGADGVQVWQRAFGAGDGYCGLTGVAFDASGRLVVSGWTGDFGPGFFDGIIARFTTAGDLDPTFAGTGLRRINMSCGGSSLDDTLSDVIVRPDGTIVVVGTTDDWTFGCIPTRYDALVAAVRPDGSDLTTFGTAGRVLVNGGGRDDGVAIVRKAGGQLVVAANRDFSGGGWNDVMLVQLKSNGSVDGAFGYGGTRTFDVLQRRTYARGLTLTADGRIGMSGYVRPTSASSARANLVVARFLANGMNDTSFAGVSYAELHLGDADSQLIGADLVENPALGGFLVAGSFKKHVDTGTFPTNVILDYRSDGVLDPAFGR